MMIHVLLVDEQHLFGEAIASLLSTEADIQVVGLAATGTEAIQITADRQPDVILMDLNLPDDMSLNTAIYLKKHFPNTKIIFLAADVSDELIIAAMSTRADGLLFKNLETDNLLRAVRDAYNNQVVISGDVANLLASKIMDVTYSKHEIVKNGLRNYDIFLTGRELDITIMVMDGLRNKEIAKALYLGEGTIKNYVSEIYDKLTLRNRQHVIAFLRGLFPRYYQF